MTRPSSALLATTGSAVMLLSVSLLTGARPVLVWNVSASAPTGLYSVVPGTPKPGDFALVKLSGSMAQLAAERGYLPNGVPLVKHVVAGAGDHACVFGRAIIINGEVVGEQRIRDERGRWLPLWAGCRSLSEGEFFLLSNRSLRSFDSRYFGPVRDKVVIGRLRPLWVSKGDAGSAGQHKIGECGETQSVVLGSQIKALVCGLMKLLGSVLTPAEAASFEGVRDHLEDAAERFKLPASWIWAVILAESNGNPDAVSPKGAIGLMQLMPGTWADMSAQHDLSADPFDPRANIMAGTAYLSAMYKRFGYPGLFAAYNAGPGRFQDFLGGGRPLPDETKAYVARIEATLARLENPAVEGRLHEEFSGVLSTGMACRHSLFFPLSRSHKEGESHEAFELQSRPCSHGWSR